ncbi:MAG: hypothetical protein KDC28_10375 [Saprospiraceae bacterium]|nr:hypothetical protein [Saprospiraceae bacterium]MCB9317701.1 hypothetical protein [Lewinellaceae bacterium]
MKTSLPIKAELQRKSIHLMMALVLIVLYRATNRPVIIGLFVALAILAGIFEWLRIRHFTAALQLQKRFAFLMRPEELESKPKDIHLIGATWVLWSLAILTILYPVKLVTLCYTMFLIADGMAALVGKWIGKHFWPASKKTMEGSLAFFISGMITMTIFPDTDLKAAGLAVFFGTISEILVKPFDDNFRVPLIVTTVYFLAEQFTG